MSQYAQDPEVKESLDAWLYLKDKTVNTLDQCFKLMGRQPIQTTSRLHDVFLEDFRKELNEIQAPLARGLYIRAKANQLMHLHIGEYAALTGMADLSGHYGVGDLIETCLADYLAFVRRTRRRIRDIVESEVAGKMKKAA
jgi:ferritin-like metal-binding protein YciE